MSVVTIHREAVKAAIRMKHGTIEAFAEARGIKSQRVRDLLRGQSNAAKPEVAKFLGVDPDQLVITRHSTDVERSSSGRAGSHRQNMEAR